VGFVVVPQHVPRAVIEEGTPREATVAPNVALVCEMEDTVGVVTVGMEPVVNEALGE
jgi:hypothetical protein